MLKRDKRSVAVFLFSALKAGIEKSVQGCTQDSFQINVFT